MAWLSQRADFKPEEFYKIIFQKGYSVMWEKSSICPCVAKDREGQPDFNCPLCFGKGRYWFDPKSILGIMTSFANESKWNQTGEYLQGTSYFTCMPENKLGFWDRITNINSKIRYSEVVERGRYNASNSDKLKFKPIQTIGLRTITTVYKANIDFKLNEADSTIEWGLGGLEPVVGEQYSVEYILHPKWIVIDLVNVLRDTQVKYKKPGVQFQEMPVRAMVRLEFFC